MSQSITPNEDPAWITVKGAIQRFSLSKSGIYRMLKADTIHAKKMGTRTLIDVSSVVAALNALPDYKT